MDVVEIFDNNRRSRRGLIKVAMLTSAVYECEWIEHVFLTATIQSLAVIAGL